MTRYIFCYEEQFIVNEENKEKKLDNYCVKNINNQYYFGEKAIKLQQIWPNLIRMHFNESVRKASTLIERKQLLKNFFSQMVNDSERNIFILPRDIVEIIEDELEEVIEKYSDQVTLMGFGMFYSKINAASKKGQKKKDSYMIHVYQGFEGIEGVLSKVNSEGKAQTISEIYVKPSNQIIIMNKVIEYLEKQVENSSNLMLYIKTESELTESFSHHSILVQEDKDKAFTFDSIDSIESSKSYNTDELHYDLKMVVKQLISRLADEKYKTLFSNIVEAFNKITVKDQEFVLDQLRKVIIKAHVISDDDLQKLRDIFLNKASSTYKVGFISPFSYGKSSLINGILGWPLLKSDIRAETAVVTHIIYGDEYSLFFIKEEEIIAARFDSIKQFKEEVEKITSVHSADETIQHLYLTLPYETKYPSIEWIDTPGLFARHEYHNQVTDEAIEGLDLVVFVFDPTKIGEKPFSKKINEYIEIIGEDNTLFAIGKRDSVIESLDLIEKELRQHLPKSQQEKEIVSASGYFALKARQYITGQLELVDLQKDYLIYALYQEDSYSGKRLEAHHIDRVLEMSNIGALERGIYKKVRKWLKEKRLNDSTIRVAIMGPLATGKSTLASSLIGRDFLISNLKFDGIPIFFQYSKKKRAEIYYPNKSKVVYPIDRIEATNNDLMKFLETAKTSSGENKDKEEVSEHRIEKVEIFSDFSICKYGLEIIDTPSFSPLYENNSRLINQILPLTNLVLFVVSPDQVGSAHSMELIKELVNQINKNRSRNNSDIFFVINKTDIYSEEEIELAENELLTILKPILPEPKIYKLSPYFAVKARMFQNKEIGLSDLQKDRRIKFTDEDGFPIGGRAIQESDIPRILGISKIQQLENTLLEFVLKGTS